MKRFLSFILILFPMVALAQQTRTITGKIFDESDGNPLPGATVFIDPSETQAKDYNPQGTVAGMDGSFSLKLPTSVQKVIVSFIGYDAQTVHIGSKNNFIIRLDPQSSDLETVVVTGYQKIEKRKLTSSISTLNMDKVSTMGVSSVDQLLEGQLAGLLSMPTSGAPGAGSSIQIRTAATITGSTDPLWVLDGMPLEDNQTPQGYTPGENLDNLYSMSIAGLSPDDIKDITVLKDAAATAIYGPRAANGVIVITTKKGSKNQPVRVNASASLFVTDRPNFSKLNMMNASEKVDLELGLAANGRLSNYKNMGSVARILDVSGERQNFMQNGFDALSSETKNAINALRVRGADWEKEIYRVALNQQYNINVSGGGEKATYYFSGGYYDEQGTTKGTGFNRLNLTMKGSYDILKNLSLGVSTFISQTKNTSYLSDKYSFMNPSRYVRNVNPYTNAYGPDGKYMYDPDVQAQEGSSLILPYNYLEEMKNTNHELKTRSIKTIFDLEYKPIKGLNIFTQFGLQTENKSKQQDANGNTYYVRWYEQMSKLDKVIYLPKGGVIQNEHNDISQYLWKIQSQYSRAFNRHEVDVMVGYEMRGYKNTYVGTKGFGYDSKTLRTIPINFPDTDRGNAIAQSSLFNPYRKTFKEDRYLSYFGTASYTYDNRYTFFGSLRYDGTNLFGVDPKYKYLPIWSVSGAWNVHNESFLKGQDWINQLSLRGSYGVQGNVDRETSPYIVGSWRTVNVGGEPEESILVNLPPNQNLRWEMTHSWNAALDLSVLDNRLKITFELFGRRSKDLITYKDIPLENGFNSVATNFGEMKSRGMELSINTVNIRTKDFRWETKFNIAHSSIKVIKESFSRNSWFPSTKGYAPNAIFGFKTAGLDDRGIPMFWMDGEKVTLEKFVNFEVKDVEVFPGWFEKMPVMEGDPEKIRDKMSYLGSYEPKFSGGFNNNFSYKGFDLSVSCNFIINRTVRFTPFYYPTAMNPGMNYSRDMKNVWSESNPNGKYPVITGLYKPDGSSWGGDWSNYDDLRVMNHIMTNVGGEKFFFQNLDIWTRKVSYLRVNNIKFGYTFPKAITDKMKLNTLRLSFEVRNPFVIATNYKGFFDPETFGNYYAQPIPRTFSFGINVSF